MNDMDDKLIQALNDAFEKGWCAAAQWANRDDLRHDTGSIAYSGQRDAILAGKAAEVRAEWQPIETAPKDGRQLILLLPPSGFPQVAYSNTWWTAGFSVECKPTHWLPLPAAAPQAKEQV